ncbi:unnamed protein product, partial [Brenthis ino]
MEFTPSLSAFQGMIISTDSVHSFSKLTSKGGNEEKIEHVIHCIRNFLQKENYIIENKVSEDAIQILRKFAFYVVINSDLTILEEMVDLDGIDFVIWTIPTIPKYLMCEILWNINLDQFIYEILVFSCPQLSLEVADALISNFKYFKPTECLQKLKLLTSACYRLICRFLFFELESDEITHAMNNFQNCLKFYSELPNSAKLDTLSKDGQYKFIGNRLFSMLQLLTECFNNFLSVQKLKPSDFQEIYELTYKEDLVINQDSSIIIADCNNHSLLECINNCHILLLDKCKTLVMDVSVEIFCAWSEFEEDDKSMQQSIGELCYKVHTTLCKIASVADHPVVSMLQQISCKPLDLVEVINKTETDVIVENVNKEDNVTAQWIKALIYRDKLCEDPVLMELLTTHLHLLNPDECYKLFKVMYNFLKNSTDSMENLLLLTIKVFQFCSNSSKQEIVEEHFINDCFNDNFLTPSFNNTITEIFNKLIISPDTDLCDVLTVFIQSPRKVYTKIFNLASENMHQTDIMLRIMKSLQKYSKHYYNEETEPCVILITKETIDNNLDTDEKQKKECTWLKSKLRNINPLNMYYFRRLWNPPGNTFVEVISGIHIYKDMDMEHLTLWLSQVICSTTLQEWYQIWDSLTVFGNGNILDIFHDALLLILVAEKSNHTESSKACLFYLMKNYVAIIRYKFFKLPLNGSQITIVFNKFALIESFIAESDVEELSTIFLPLFAFMSTTKEDLSIDIPQSIIKKLKHSIFIDVITNLFIKTTQSQIKS